MSVVGVRPDAMVIPPEFTSTRPVAAIERLVMPATIAGAIASVALPPTVTELDATMPGAAISSVPSATRVGPEIVPLQASVSVWSPAFMTPAPAGATSCPPRITSPVPPAVFVTANVASPSSVTVPVEVVVPR